MKTGISVIALALLVLVAFPAVSGQAWVHKDYDWEGDDGDLTDLGDTNTSQIDPPRDWEGCFACHWGGHWGGPSRLCEECHVNGYSNSTITNTTGPFMTNPGDIIDPTTSNTSNYTSTLRGDYSAPRIFQHYTGASAVSISSAKIAPTYTSSSCFSYNSTTKKWKCHGVSATYSISTLDGKYAFNIMGVSQVKNCAPSFWTTNGTLPDSTNCSYCHKQTNPAIWEAWGNATEPPASYCNSSNCYTCHTTNKAPPSSFHATTITINWVTPPPTTPPAGGGGGGGAVTPPTEQQAPLQEGLNTLTTDSYRNIIIELDLRYIDTFVAPSTLAGPVTLLGKYPRPTDSGALRALAKSSETIQGDVYDITASRVLEKYSTVSSLVIARGDLGVDSMAAVAYAKARNIPILLTKPGELPSSTLSAISKLKPNDIIVVGGPVAVSREVEAALAKSARVDRIQGLDRYETAVELAKRALPSTVVIADGVNPKVDAVFMSHLLDAPLIYVNSTGMTSSVRAYLSTRKITQDGKKLKVLTVGVSAGITAEIDNIII